MIEFEIRAMRLQHGGKVKATMDVSFDGIVVHEMKLISGKHGIQLYPPSVKRGNTFLDVVELPASLRELVTIEAVSQYHAMEKPGCDNLSRPSNISLGGSQNDF